MTGTKLLSTLTFQSYRSHLRCFTGKSTILLHPSFGGCRDEFDEHRNKYFSLNVEDSYDVFKKNSKPHCCDFLDALV